MPEIVSEGMYEKTPYMLMEYVSGTSYAELMTHSQQAVDQLIFQLGMSVAKLHTQSTEKFGHIQSIDVPQQKIKCQSESWADYIFTQLDNHLRLCLQEQYLSEEDCEESQAIFAQLVPSIEIKDGRLLHCDLGKQNIFQSTDGRLVLIDWEDALGGDPVFDIAMWGSFMGNEAHINTFLKGYGQANEIPQDFKLRYHLYHYRIVLAKTVHRYRFQYCKNDKIHASVRLGSSLTALRTLLQGHMA